LGYKSENYEQEVNDNNKFERMTIEEFQNYIISRNKNTNKYNEHLNVFSTIFSVELEKNITVPDFYKKVLEIIQNYEPDKKKVEWLKDDLIFVLVSNIVNYNAELLVKHIRGQKGGKTKKKKIKKRKSKKRKSKKRKSKNN